MRKRNIVIVAVLLSCLLAGVALVLGSVLNTISFHGTITPGASMTPINLNLGAITEDSTGGSGPSGNGTPFDANATLTLPALSSVTLSFANSSDLTPFTAFSVLVQLYQNGSPIFQGGISESTISYTIQNVASGTYELFVGYTYTAGSNETSFNITVNVSV